MLEGLIGAIIGGLIAVGSNVLNRKHQREDKRDERANHLTDKHRDDLRHAYGEFIAACLAYVDYAQQFAAAERVILEAARAAYVDAATTGGGEEDADRAYDDVAKNSELAKKQKQTLDLFLAAATKLDEKATLVMLLEDDREFLARIDVLVDRLPRLPEPDDYTCERFVKIIDQRLELLGQLRESLRGHFAPSSERARGAIRLKAVGLTKSEAPDAEGWTVFDVLVEKLDEYLESLGKEQRGLLIADQGGTDPGQQVRLLRMYQRQGTEIRGRRIRHVIDNVHFVDSYRSPGTQLADVCGYFLRRHVEGRQDKEWFARVEILAPAITRIPEK